MIIDFESGHIVKKLARRLQSRVEQWGDTLKYNHALIIVARMFGHDDYQVMTHRFGVADPSISDIEASPEERERRYRQYIEILSQNDFSVEEAEMVVDTVFFGKWWGFKTERPTYPPPDPRIRAVVEPVGFQDERVVEQLHRVLKKSVKESGVEPWEGEVPLRGRFAGADSPKQSRLKFLAQPVSDVSATVMNTGKRGVAKSLALSIDELRKQDPELAVDLIGNVVVLRSAKKRKDRELSAKPLGGSIAESERPQGLLNVRTKPRSDADRDADKDVVGRAGPSSEPKAKHLRQ
ncbi:hypothetical protein [Rhizobium binae]|uniref:hypothetical protein n=1 Tax=Rhizobium binae TaxID=1138190 RepID=UPI003DA916B6